MPRKRKQEQTAQTATHEPDVFDQAIADRKAAEQPTHAEKVKRPPGYLGVGGSDYAAGVYRDEYQDKEAKAYVSIIRFDEAPSKDVTKLLRENGFDFSRENEEWYRPIAFETRQADRLNAERVFKEALKLVRTDKGLGESQGVA